MGPELLRMTAVNVLALAPVSDAALAQIGAVSPIVNVVDAQAG